jgi:hypothetical protein
MDMNAQFSQFSLQLPISFWRLLNCLFLLFFDLTTFTNMIKNKLLNDSVMQSMNLELSDSQDTSEKFTSTKKRRRNLTIEQKIEIIQRYEKGETQKELAEAYGIGR